jgi:hypothetical protein
LCGDRKAAAAAKERQIHFLVFASAGTFAALSLTCPPSLSASLELHLLPVRLLKTGIHSPTGFRSPGKRFSCMRLKFYCFAERLLLLLCSSCRSDRLMDTRMDLPLRPN